MLFAGIDMLLVFEINEIFEHQISFVPLQ